MMLRERKAERISRRGAAGSPPGAAGAVRGTVGASVEVTVREGVGPLEPVTQTVWVIRVAPGAPSAPGERPGEAETAIPSPCRGDGCGAGFSGSPRAVVRMSPSPREAGGLSAPSHGGPRPWPRGLFSSSSAAAGPGPDAGLPLTGPWRGVALGVVGRGLRGGAQTGERGVRAHAASEPQGTRATGSVLFWSPQLCRDEGEATADGSPAGTPVGRPSPTPGTSACRAGPLAEPFVCQANPSRPPGKLPVVGGGRSVPRSDPSLAPQGEAGLPSPAWVGAPGQEDPALRPVPGPLWRTHSRGPEAGRGQTQGSSQSLGAGFSPRRPSTGPAVWMGAWRRSPGWSSRSKTQTRRAWPGALRAPAACPPGKGGVISPARPAGRGPEQR